MVACAGGSRARARLLSAEAVRPLGQFADARRELEAAMAECDEALNVLGVLPEGGNAIAAREAEDAALAEAAEAAAMSPSGRRRKGASHSAPPPPSRQWVGSEVDLSLRTGADASPYLAIRLLTLQALVGMDLTACKFEDGANRAECMRAMVEAYLGRFDERRLQRTLLRGRCCTRWGATKRRRRGSRRRRRRRRRLVPLRRGIWRACAAL